MFEYLRTAETGINTTYCTAGEETEPQSSIEQNQFDTILCSPTSCPIQKPVLNVNLQRTKCVVIDEQIEQQVPPSSIVRF